MAGQEARVVMKGRNWERTSSATPGIFPALAVAPTPVIGRGDMVLGEPIAAVVIGICVAGVVVRAWIGFRGTVNIVHELCKLFLLLLLEVFHGLLLGGLGLRFGFASLLLSCRFLGAGTIRGAGAGALGSCRP